MSVFSAHSPLPLSADLLKFHQNGGEVVSLYPQVLVPGIGKHQHAVSPPGHHALARILPPGELLISGPPEAVQSGDL